MRELPWPRLLATDLDGTLLRSDSSVSPRTVAALREYTGRGGLVVLMTARPPRRMDRILDDLGFAPYAVICGNGAMHYDGAERRVIRSIPLPLEAARAATTILSREVPGAGFAVETGQRLVSEAAFRTGHPSGSPFDVQTLAELLVPARPILKILAWAPDLDVAACTGLAAGPLGEHAALTYSGLERTVELTAPAATKESALAEVCLAADMPAAAVIAFGDMPNDRGFLAWSGTAVAMGNAEPSVREVADVVAAGNDEDGLAEVVEALLLRHEAPQPQPDQA